MNRTASRLRKVSDRRYRSSTVIIGSAIFILLTSNVAFFSNFVDAYRDSSWVGLHVLSLGLLLGSTLLMMLSLVCWPGVLRLVLPVLFIVSALTAYFMDTYNVVIDEVMLSNIAATDMHEATELVTARLFAYLLVLGLLPSVVVWRIRLVPETAAGAVLARTGMLGAGVLLSIAVVLSSSAFYSTYIRETKHLRYYSNPLTPIYSLVHYAHSRLKRARAVFHRIGQDAHIPPSDPDRELVVMVVGETARADRFSLNGYSRETNPRLSQLDVISFPHVSACGTSTGVSLPCMFSLADRSDFDSDDSELSENVLDVLDHAGVTILWRDNNTGSKGVSTRVRTEDFTSAAMNPDCEVECRDDGMLDGLQTFIDMHPTGDVLIVLHQAGSHGPAYYKRYPKVFEQFRPACESAQLDTCTVTEIGNSYDNSILYTDYFLAGVIDLLSANDDRFETALLYVSDHGESLGESGVYLHGYPYVLAPDEQVKVPMIMWLGRNYHDAEWAALRRISGRKYSHDNVFHTLLGFFEIESEIYNPELDILQQSRLSNRVSVTAP